MPAMVIAGTAALVALATVVVALVRLHLKPTGLSAIRNPVSQYGICEFRAGYRTATLAFAAAGAALAVALARAVLHGTRGIVALLVVFAAARAVISWFPMDAPNAKHTPTGGAHGLLAIAAFGSVTAAALRLGGALSEQARWHALAGVSTALGALMLALLATMATRRAIPLLARWFGALERAFYLAAIAWCLVFALASALA